VNDLRRYFQDLAVAVAAELKEQGAFEGVSRKFKEIGDTSDVTLAKITRFLSTVSGGEAEKSASGWARIVDVQFIKPLERLLDVVNGVVEAIGRLFSFADRYAATAKLFGFTSVDLPGTVSSQFGLPSVPQGGTFSVPLGTVPPRAPTVNVTVNGAIDSEGTARTIRRVLEDANRRTGVDYLFDAALR